MRVQKNGNARLCRSVVGRKLNSELGVFDSAELYVSDSGTGAKSSGSMFGSSAGRGEIFDCHTFTNGCAGSTASCHAQSHTDDVLGWSVKTTRSGCDRALRQGILAGPRRLAFDMREISMSVALLGQHYRISPDGQ